MASGTSYIVGGGIQAGGTFALNHLLYVTNVSPAQASTFAASVVTDSGSAVPYLDIPNSTGTSVPSNTNTTETLRVKGGMIVEGAGTDTVQIGRGASAGALATDTIVIGHAASTTATLNVVIGANTSVAGNAGVFIGANQTVTLAGGVIIGQGATITGNAGGAGGVVLGTSATLATGNVGGGTGVVIGQSASAGHPSSVVIGCSAAASFASNVGQNSVIIGQGSTSNKAGTTIIGGSATVNQTGGIAIGAGASSNLNSSTATQASIVIGQTASTNKDGCIVIGSTSALTSTASACIGHGCLDMGANVIQLGGPGGSYDVIVLGAGDTKATPAAKGLRFTNGSGADNAAGTFTLLAPLSTGNATPASLIFMVGQQVAGSSSTLQTAGNALVLSHTTAGGFLATFGGGIKTSTPNGGTAGIWKGGIFVAAAVTADGNYVQLDVNGTLYKLMTGV